MIYISCNFLEETQNLLYDIIQTNTEVFIYADVISLRNNHEVLIKAQAIKEDQKQKAFKNRLYIFSPFQCARIFRFGEDRVKECEQFGEIKRLTGLAETHAANGVCPDIAWPTRIDGSFTRPPTAKRGLNQSTEKNRYLQILFM